MNSFNHYSLGSVGEWLYQSVAGIRALEPGYERVLIAPGTGRSGVGARGLPVRARADRQRLAAIGGDVIELEVSIPVERVRDRESCPAVRRPSRSARANTASAA